jgi:predicted metal-binding membrane protein
MPHPQSAGSWTVSHRDRTAILTALAGVTMLAWLYLIRTAGGMDSAGPMEMVRVRAWGSSDFFFTFLMWTIMMVGMIVPSAIPTTLVYGAVVRGAARRGTVVAPTMVFVTGYLAVWTLFSLGATLAQWGLDRAVLLSPMMVTTSPAVGAALLIAAGLYQLTPAKRACLSHCRSPAHFISTHWRPNTAGAFRMGLEHGVYCLGCCWLLMGLLFVVGVMNLLWIAAIAVFVLLEKIVPHETLPARIGGLTMILSGSALLATWL